VAADISCNICATQIPGASAPVCVKDGFEIVRCPRCRLLFRRDVPDADAVAAIYSDEYFRRAQDDPGGQGYDDYLLEEELHRLNGRVRVRLLRRFGATGRLFDVGAAAGFFMDEARLAGWAVEGADVSPTMSGFGRDHLGLSLQTATFDAAAAEGPFDCVTMWDYIEHSINPLGDLRRAHDLLGPGGVLALSTGDVTSLVARVSGRRWHLLTPRHHNFFFSADNLRLACHNAGLEVLWARHPGSRYSLRYLTYKLRSMLPESALVRRIGEVFSRGAVGRLALPVNLGDIVTVVARRPA
jgi:SAM-dependent methyltransferase